MNLPVPPTFPKLAFAEWEPSASDTPGPKATLRAEVLSCQGWILSSPGPKAPAHTSLSRPPPLAQLVSFSSASEPRPRTQLRGLSFPNWKRP